MPIRSRQTVQQHMAQHPCCQLTALMNCCRGLPGQPHHIQMGTGNRHDAEWNLLTVCGRMHDQIHRQPKVFGLVICYYAKRLTGPVDWELIRHHCGQHPLARIERDLPLLDGDVLTWGRQLCKEMT